MRRIRGFALCAALLVAGIPGAYHVWYTDWRDSVMSGPADSWSYFGPSAYYLDASLARRDFPLWNPLILCGLPYAANPQSKAFYPPNLVRSALTGDPTPERSHASMRLYFLAHTMLAGLGTFALARRLGIGTSGGLVAAFFFAFSANFVYRSYASHFIDVVAWLPVIWLLFECSLTAPSRQARISSSIGAGLCISVSFLAGHPQGFLYGGTILLAYIVCRGIAGATNISRVEFASRGASALALAALVTVPASMILLLPAYEFFSLSARRGSSLIETEAIRGFGSWREFAEAMLVFRGPLRFSPGLSSLGIIHLAVVGVVLSRKRMAVVLTVLFLCGIDLAVGPSLPVSALLDIVSPFELAQPQRALIVATLPLGLLAGMGIDVLAHAGQRRIAVYGICAAAAVLLPSAGLAFMNPPHPAIWTTDWSPTLIAVLGLPALLVPLVVLASIRPMARIVPIAATLIVVAELMVWNATYARELSALRSPFSGNARGGSATEIQRANVRIPEWYPNLNIYEFAPSPTGYEPAFLANSWSVLTPPQSREYVRILSTLQVSRQNPLGSTLLDRPFRMVPSYIPAEFPGNHRLLPLNRAAYTGTTRPAYVPELSAPSEAVSGSEGTALEIERMRRGEIRGTLPTSPLRKSLLVGYSASGTAHVLSEFRDGDRDALDFGWTQRVDDSGGEVSWMEIPVPAAAGGDFKIVADPVGPGSKIEISSVRLRPDPADESERIEIVLWTADEVEVAISLLPGYRLLVFTDAMYPGWRAFIDGAETPIMHANGAFKAVEVPAGSHRVRFEFRPMSVYASAIVSLVAWAASIVVLLALSRHRRRSATTAQYINRSQLLG